MNTKINSTAPAVGSSALLGSARWKNKNTKIEIEPMNEETKKKLEAAIVACAEKAAKSETTALDAMQLTQAAVNASNAIIGLEINARQKG